MVDGGGHGSMRRTVTRLPGRTASSTSSALAVTGSRKPGAARSLSSRRTKPAWPAAPARQAKNSLGPTLRFWRSPRACKKGRQSLARLTAAGSLMGLALGLRARHWQWRWKGERSWPFRTQTRPRQLHRGSSTPLLQGGKHNEQVTPRSSTRQRPLCGGPGIKAPQRHASVRAWRSRNSWKYRAGPWRTCRSSRPHRTPPPPAPPAARCSAPAGCWPPGSGRPSARSRAAAGRACFPCR